MERKGKIISLNKEELEQAQTLGATTYMAAYVTRMIRAIGIVTDESDPDPAEINAMVLDMVEPLNLATMAIWCALMKDSKGVERALIQLDTQLDHLIKA